MTIYISLGWNCFPRQAAVENLLEKTKAEGYKTCPFDLMGVCYPSLCLLIENSFEDFCNPNYLIVDENFYIVNTKYNLRFSHESPNHYEILGSTWTSSNHFVENNFEKLIERYITRIENFYDYINNAILGDTDIFFIINRYNSLPIEIYDIIKDKFPLLSFKIFCFSNNQKELEYQKYIEYCNIDSELERFSRQYEKPLFNNDIIDYDDIKLYSGGIPIYIEEVNVNINIYFNKPKTSNRVIKIFGKIKDEYNIKRELGVYSICEDINKYLGKPKFRNYSINDKIMTKLILGNGHIFMNLAPLDEKKYFLSLCAIIKNEIHIIEWINYYLKIGVEHFFIYDNESDIPLSETLNDYKSVCTIKRVKGKNKQLGCYKECIKEYGKLSEWIAFIDGDEYILPIEDNNLTDFLLKRMHLQAVGINWILYGTSFHNEKPNGSVIENFTYNEGIQNMHIKTILKPKHFIDCPNNPHHMIMENPKLYQDPTGFLITGPFNHNQSISIIRINHYCVYSEEEFNNKIKRGKALGCNVTGKLSVLVGHYYIHTPFDDNDIHTMCNQFHDTLIIDKYCK